MHPAFSFKFLHWLKKLSLKKVRLQLGVLQYFYFFIRTFKCRYLLLMSEDADVLIFWKLSYLTRIYGGFLQPCENNDKTFQTFNALRLA